jgi:hypothetical protein
MIGSLTVGKKAAKYGYKAYGVPGAAIAGAGGAVGVAVAKKGIQAAVETDAEASADTIADEGVEIDVESEDDTDEVDGAASADR